MAATVPASAAAPRTYAGHEQARGFVGAAPAVLFEHLDDPRRLAGHMQERSNPLAHLLGRTYARWCRSRMLRDAQGAFAPALNRA